MTWAACNFRSTRVPSGGSLPLGVSGNEVSQTLETGVLVMKSLLIALVLAFGVAAVASAVLPTVALACEPSDPSCNG